MVIGHIFLKAIQVYKENNIGLLSHLKTLTSMGLLSQLFNMGKSGSSHFRDPPLISEESPLKSEAMLIKYLLFWDC